MRGDWTAILHYFICSRSHQESFSLLQAIPETNLKKKHVAQLCRCQKRKKRKTHVKSKQDATSPIHHNSFSQSCPVHLENCGNFILPMRPVLWTWRPSQTSSSCLWLIQYGLPLEKARHNSRKRPVVRVHRNHVWVRYLGGLFFIVLLGILCKGCQAVVSNLMPTIDVRTEPRWLSQTRVGWCMD